MSNIYKMDADLRYFVLIYLGRKRSLVRLYLVISRDLQSLVITCVISRTNMRHNENGLIQLVRATLIILVNNYLSGVKESF